MRHILHIIHEEDVSLATTGVGGLSVSIGSTQHGNSTTGVGGLSVYVAFSSGGETEGKSKSANNNSRSWVEK